MRQTYLEVWFVPTNQCSMVLEHDSGTKTSTLLWHNTILVPRHTRLTLDGFELLGDPPYHEVLRDGNLRVLGLTVWTSSNVLQTWKALEKAEGICSKEGFEDNASKVIIFVQFCK